MEPNLAEKQSFKVDEWIDRKLTDQLYRCCVEKEQRDPHLKESEEKSFHFSSLWILFKSTPSSTKFHIHHQVVNFCRKRFYQPNWKISLTFLFFYNGYLVDVWTLACLVIVSRWAAIICINDVNMSWNISYFSLKTSGKVYSLHNVSVCVCVWTILHLFMDVQEFPTKRKVRSI